MNYKFSIKAALKYGFGATLDNIVLMIQVLAAYVVVWAVFFGVVVVTIGVPVVTFFSGAMPQLMQGCQDKEQCSLLANQIAQNAQALPWLSLGLIGFAFYVVVMGLGLGLWRILFDVYDTGKSRVARLFSCFALVPKVFITSILYALIVFGGILLLVIPGIYWGMRFGYCSYLIIDKNAGIIESLKESYRATAGSVWRLVLFFCAGFLILLIAKPLAIFAVLPIIWFANIYVYRTLVPKA